MQTPQKKKFPGKYAPQLKLAIARDYFTSNLGYGSLAKKYDVPAGTVPSLIQWYRKKYPDQAEGAVEADATEETSPPPINNKELKEAGLKITALEMLIENAGKELGVDLVKKFSTRQPKK